MRTLPDDALFPERRIAWVQPDPEVVDLASPAGTGQDGIRYVSVHLRRPGLQLGRFG